jgi:hypothetical protein
MCYLARWDWWMSWLKPEGMYGVLQITLFILRDSIILIKVVWLLRLYGEGMLHKKWLKFKIGLSVIKF